MKKLSKDEMKIVLGGILDLEEAPCQSVCSKTIWSGGRPVTTTGTCTQGIIYVNHQPFPDCQCSLSGGTSCYKPNGPQVPEGGI